MYFINICNNIDVIRIIYLVSKIFNLACIIIPIVLIVMITIDLLKSVIGDEKDSKKNNKTIINRIVFALLLFFVPTFVTIVINVLNVTGITSEYKDCLTNANASYIKEYNEKEKANN